MRTAGCLGKFGQVAEATVLSTLAAVVADEAGADQVSPRPACRSLHRECGIGHSPDITTGEVAAFVYGPSSGASKVEVVKIEGGEKAPEGPAHVERWGEDGLWVPCRV